jgi:hypothetical protein
LNPFVTAIICPIHEAAVEKSDAKCAILTAAVADMIFSFCSGTKATRT